MKIILANTRIENVDLEGQSVYFKREDQNPGGSFKDRLIDFLWEELKAIPENEIVLSSSGNLAMSLLTWQLSDPLPKKITIFVKPNLPASKNAKLLDLVQKVGATLVESKRPKSDCFKYARDNKAFWLRNSTGESYPQAYYGLANEIAQEYAKQKFGAIFVCCSSGTATQGIAEGLLQQNLEIPVIAVQTSHVQPLAKDFDAETYEETTLANAISDKVMTRKLSVNAVLRRTAGLAVAANNSEIAEALELLKENLAGSEFTGNAALSLAGFLKLQKKGYNFLNPLIIISGN